MRLSRVSMAEMSRDAPSTSRVMPSNNIGQSRTADPFYDVLLRHNYLAAFFAHSQLAPIFASGQPSLHEVVEFAVQNVSAFQELVEFEGPQPADITDSMNNLRDQLTVAKSLLYGMNSENIRAANQAETTTPPILVDSPPPNPSKNILAPLPSHKRFSGCYDWLLLRTTETGLCEDARDVLPAEDTGADPDVIEITDDMDRGAFSSSPLHGGEARTLTSREAIAEWVTAVGRQKAPGARTEYDMGLRKFITGLATACKMRYSMAAAVIAEAVRHTMAGEAYYPNLTLLATATAEVAASVNLFMQRRLAAKEEELRQLVMNYESVHGRMSPEQLQATTVQHNLVISFCSLLVSGTIRIPLSIPPPTAAFNPAQLYLPFLSQAAYAPKSPNSEASYSPPNSFKTYVYSQPSVIMSPGKFHKASMAMEHAKMSSSGHPQLAAPLATPSLLEDDDVQFLGVFVKTYDTVHSLVRRKRRIKEELAIND